MSLTTTIKNNFKNVFGKTIKKKIVVFSVDDYGNVRVDSAAARQRMDKAGLKIHSRFDAFDSLENEADLLELFDVLSSVKDVNGNHAIFTAFALPCNIDFERMRETNYTAYHYETLPLTFSKLGQSKVFDLWKEGISKRLLIPQFHGREHLNLKVFNELLARRNSEILVALENRSYCSIPSSGYSTISYPAAFEFDKLEENKNFEPIIRDGLDRFREVFGFSASHFNPPGGREHGSIHRCLLENGIKYLDTPSVKMEHQGNGRYKKVLNYMGKKNALGQTYLIRNAVFEPTHKNFDWVGMCLKQIEVAFRWNKPAIISSHRVNFSGNIDPANRNKGLRELKRLLQTIVKKWPDAEFKTANEVGDLVSK